MSMSHSHPKLGLIAGGGDLPVTIADAVASQDRELFILGVRGFADDSILNGREGIMLSIGETGAQIKALKHAGVEEICFAGIVNRPDFKAIKLDAKGLSILPKVLAAAGKGDDALLRAILSVFEKEGFRIVGADDVAKRIVVSNGQLTQSTPSEQEFEDMVRAAEIAAAIGRLDVGQGAVVCRGLPLAVEAAEGTDEMLKRCSSLPEDIRGTQNSKSGVLVKRPKPVQERRVDMPTIGIETIEGVAKAGLAGIGLEAEGALILDRENVIRRADALGIWIYAFRQDEL